MAEPNGTSEAPQKAGEPAQPAPAVPVSTPTEAVTSRDVFLGSRLEPSDDTPTLITRVTGSPTRMEDALAGVLRGRQLAQFELLEPIGVGGMAAVIRARDTQLDRNVALKILPPEMAGDEEIVRRFHQEARSAAKLDHENIARVFFCGEDQGLHFIAFEFVEGINLRTLLDRRGRIPVREALGYMLQIATGLAHAAARGVVHRDIKPSNIIISPNGRAKLVDMGLARSLEPQPDGGLTQSGVTLGTFDYISPEQALEPREADVRSDIYSLGCTFYHMLTGQAPVPEGTAAKKLHHHQHVDPMDPRQLNPEIPSEVVALLARMMAKDRGERYQHPEELVQHLFVLAQKLGAVSEVPEGLLFLDAPLPGPPRTRPMVLAIVSMLGLVAVIAFLGPGTPMPSQKGTALIGPAPADGQAAAPPQAVPGDPPQRPLEPPAGAEQQTTEPFHPQTGKDFAEYLRANRKASVELINDIVLTPETLLVFKGDSLDITASTSTSSTEKIASAVPLRTIRLDFNPNVEPESWVALLIRSGTVKIRGVRFVVDAHTAPGVAMTGVECNGGQVTLEKCEFVQQNATHSEVSSVLVRSTSLPADEPMLRLISCYFPGGQRAVTASGAVKIQAQQCAFGPHSVTLFDLQQEPSRRAKGDASITLWNCSAFVTGRSVFRVGEETSPELKIRNSVFSHLERSEPNFEFVALIDQPTNASNNCRYTGSGNRYHNLDALWLRGRDTAAHLAEFQRMGAEEDNSMELTQSPWANGDPLQALQSGNPQLAFQVQTDRPELRQDQNPTKLVGVEECVWGRSYDPIIDRKPVEPLVRKQEEKIVDPNSARSGNTYTKLRQALDDVNPGDVILLKWNGLYRVDPVQLEKAGADVTIRPYPNSHPVLTIGPTTEPDAAMFRVHDGQLKLEQLEFRLAPVSTEFRAQAVVMIMGDGQCTFKDCVATLEEATQVPLTLVTLADPSAVMKMTPQPTQQQEPRVSLENCLVRGLGNLVAVRASRSFSLDAQDCLVTLAGSFLVIDGNSKETSTHAEAKVSLQQVTTYLTDHLVLLRALKEEGKRRKGLGWTEVKSAACLFASATGSKSLVHLAGIETEAQMSSVFGWRSSQDRNNAYSNFTRYLEQEPSPGGPMAPPAYGEQKWRDFSQDNGPRFEQRVKFTSPPAPDAPLSRVAAADFKTKPEANLQGFGANIDHLPRPADESATGSLPIRPSGN